MKKKTYADAERESKRIDSVLKATDFDPDDCVKVNTDEGRECLYPAAFVVEYANWYLIFGEHMPPIALEKSDVVLIYEFKIKRTPFRKSKDMIPS